MTTIINGSSPSITFSDATTQTTAGLPLTGGNITGNLNVSGNAGIGTTSPQSTVGVNVALTDTKGVVLQYSGEAKGGMLLNPTSGEFRMGSINASGTYFTTFYANNAEAMRIDSGGNLYLNTTTQNDYGKLNINFASSGPNIGIGMKQTNNSGGTFVNFFNYAGTGQGSITNNNNGTVSYNSSSDYRLKENIEPLESALETTLKLKPCKYNFIGYEQKLTGFIAHELQEVIPQAVSGEKDGVNEDNSIKPQGIDTSFLVATLTAAIQELNAKVDAQATTITELQARLVS
jgi:hypothetical protein